MQIFVHFAKIVTIEIELLANVKPATHLVQFQNLLHRVQVIGNDLEFTDLGLDLESRAIVLRHD